MDSRKAILGFVRSARRRLSTIRGLYWAQRALFAAICVAVVAIAFERATGLWNPPVWTLGAAAGLVALAGIVAYFVPRRSMLAAAAEVDARAGWKEALSSAIAVGEPKESMEMALLEDARARAARARPSALFGLSSPPEMKWSLLPVALVVAAFFVPRLDLFGHEAQAKKEEEKKAQVKRIVERLEKDKEKLSKGDKAEKPKLVAAEALKELEKLQAELGKEPLERKEAMAELAKAEERLKDLKNQFNETRELAQKLQKAASKEGEDAGELGQKIKEGKFDEAAQELAKMRNKLQEGKLTEEEKKRLSEQLQALKSKLGNDEKLNEFEKAVSKALDGLDENREMDFEDLQDALQDLEGDLAEMGMLEDVLREMQGMKEDLAKGEEGEEGS